MKAEEEVHIQPNLIDIGPPTTKEKKESRMDGLRRLVAESRRVETLSECHRTIRTVLIDPPWQYTDRPVPPRFRQPYDTMTVGEMVAAFDVKALAHPDGCCFWIWTTWPMIRDGSMHELLDGWALEWKGEFVWEKPGLGIGRWLRPATEVLTLSVTGKPILMETTGLRAHFTATTSHHSAKPDISYETVARLSAAPRLEMFSRKARPGWIRWGNQA